MWLGCYHKVHTPCTALHMYICTLPLPGCEDVIEEDSIEAHLCSDSGALLYLLSSHTHVLPQWSCLENVIIPEILGEVYYAHHTIMHGSDVFTAGKSFLVQTSTKHSAVPMAGSLCVTRPTMVCSCKSGMTLQGPV